MKATGIVRRLDDLGRIVIPKEIRRTLEINEGDPMEIFLTEDGGVVLQKSAEPAKDKNALAQKWLDNNEALIRRDSARFSIEDRTTVCEIVSSSHRRTGTATAMISDPFIPAVGMVIAYCRAKGVNVPKELLKD